MRSPVPARLLTLAWLLALPLGGIAQTKAEDVPVDCRVVYDHADGVYVDAGTQQGLSEGRVAVLMRDGRRVGRAQIEAVKKDSAFLRMLSPRRSNHPTSGIGITLILKNVPQEVEADPVVSSTAQERQPSETLRGEQGSAAEFPAHPATGAGEGGAAGGGAPSADPAEGSGARGGEPPPEGSGDAAETGAVDSLDARDPAFVPLLSTPDSLSVTSPHTVVSGRATLRNLTQVASDDRLEYYLTRLGTSGTIERLAGSPWSLEWSGDFSTRYGEGYEDVDDYQNLRSEVYRLALSRRFEDGSSMRVGRFIPRELPGVGYVDGLHGEKVVSERWRVGGVLGFTPERDHLAFSMDEQIAAPYVTYFSQRDNGDYYSATGGLYFSHYDGDLDRLAFMADQTAQFGAFSLYSTTEIDFDVGDAEVNDGTRFTRGDLTLSWARPGWTPRLGIVRWERPDTEAERDLIDEPFVDIRDYFEDDFWRYFVGARHQLGAGFVLDEEIGYTQADSDDELHWRVSLTKRSSFDSGQGSTTLSVYSLTGLEQDGFGARLSGYYPAGNSRLVLQPSATFRYVSFDTGNGDFEVGDLSLRANWMASRVWSAFGGISMSASDEEQRVLIETGITWRF